MNSFWKTLKIAGLILLIFILTIIAAGLIFLKTFDIKRYKTQIIHAADNALGRHLDFNDIELKVSLQEGIRFYVTDVSMSEHPDFGQENFLKIKEVFLGVDILSFLNARQISVPSILIKSPEVTIIQDAKGRLNVQSIGSGSKVTASSQTTANAGPAAALPAILINSLSIEDAHVRFVDKSVDPHLQAEVSKMDFKVERFSLDKPFDFILQAAVLSSTRNLKIDGTVDLNVLSQKAKLSNVHLGMDLGQLGLDEIRRLPALKDVPFPEILQGQLSLTLKECLLSSKGVGNFIVDAQLDSGKILIKEAAPGIPVDLSSIRLEIKDFTLARPFFISLQTAVMNSEPNVDLQGTVALDLAAQSAHLKDVTFKTDLAKWPLAKMKSELAPLKEVKLPEVLYGLFNVTVKELSVGPKGLGDLSVDAQLQDGQVDIKEIAPQTNLSASKINLNVKNFSLGGPFEFALDMAYLNPNPNIDLRGTVTLDTKTQSVRLQDVQSTIDLGMLSLDELKSSVGAIKGAPLPQILEGKLVTSVKNLEAGAQGLKSVLMNLKLHNGRVLMPDAAPGISINAKDINLDVQEFALDKEFGLKLGVAYLSDSPNIQFDGRMFVDLAAQAVTLKNSRLAIDLSKIDLEELKSSVVSLANVPLPENLAGNLKVDINEVNAGAKGLTGMQMDVALENAAVSLKDLTPGVSLQASQIGLDVKNISLEKKPMQVRLNAAVFSDQPNMDFNGTAILDMPQSSVEIKEAVFKTDLSLLSMERLKSSIQSLKDVSLPEELRGLLNVQIDVLAAGPKGMSNLQSRGSLTSAVIKLKELKLPINISQLKFQADGVKATFDDVNVALGKGTIKTKASIDQYLTKPMIHKEVLIEGLDLEEILEQKDAPVKAQGLVYAEVKIEGDPSNLNSLNGEGTFELKEGKLQGLNIIKSVFDAIKLPLLPHLSSIVMSALPEEYKKQFEKPDTDLKSVKSSFGIAHGEADLTTINVESDLFVFDGTGKAGFDQSYKIDGGFNIAQDLSQLLIKDVENPFAYMRNEQNLVSFPVHVMGKGSASPKIEVEAVVKDVLKNAVQSKGKEELGRFLDKVLNKNGIQTQTTPEPGEGESPSNQMENQSPQEPPQKSTGEQLIEGVFGTIFK